MQWRTLFGFNFKLLEMKDLKYLLAYLMPVSAACALYWQGPWSWSTVVWSFVVIPLAELALPVSTANAGPEEEERRAASRLFDWLLYLNAPILFGITG